MFTWQSLTAAGQQAQRIRSLLYILSRAEPDVIGAAHILIAFFFFFLLFFFACSCVHDAPIMSKLSKRVSLIKQFLSVPLAVLSLFPLCFYVGFREICLHYSANETIEIDAFRTVRIHTCLRYWVLWWCRCVYNKSMKWVWEERKYIQAVIMEMYTDIYLSYVCLRARFASFFVTRIRPRLHSTCLQCGDCLGR